MDDRKLNIDHTRQLMRESKDGYIGFIEVMMTDDQVLELKRIMRQDRPINWNADLAKGEAF